MSTSFDWTQISQDESVVEELAVLEAIYPEFLSVDHKHSTVEITLIPQTGDEGLAMVRASLLLIFHDKYPADQAPQLRLINGRGLSDSSLHDIEHSLLETAESLSGTNCVFQIVEEARDHITSMNEQGAECEICYGRIDQTVQHAKSMDTYTGEVGFVTQCLHVFHQGCFARWMWEYDQRMNQSSERQSQVHVANSRITAAINSVNQFRETIEKLEQQIEDDTKRLNDLEDQYKQISQEMEEMQQMPNSKRKNAEDKLYKQKREVRINIESTEHRLKNHQEKLKISQSKVQDAEQRQRNIEAQESGRLESRSKDTPCPCCREIVPFRIISESYHPENFTNFYETCETLYGEQWQQSLKENEIKEAAGSKGESNRHGWEGMSAEVTKYVAEVQEQCQNVFRHQKEKGGLIDCF